MTLYRIGKLESPQQEHRLVALGVLVPVEPCEHGKYDEHVVPLTRHHIETLQSNLCPGGIGGDDE